MSAEECRSGQVNQRSDWAEWNALNAACTCDGPIHMTADLPLPVSDALADPTSLTRGELLPQCCLPPSLQAWDAQWSGRVGAGLCLTALPGHLTSQPAGGVLLDSCQTAMLNAPMLSCTV